jgi:hypothetical protein
LEQALAALRDALADMEVPWMVIGGIAAVAHGVHRLTTDIDAVLWGNGVDVRPLLRDGSLGSRRRVRRSRAKTTRGPRTRDPSRHRVT